MKSIRQQIELLEGMLGTKDLTPWEQGFVETVSEKKHDTAKLSEKQVAVVDKLYEKHFGPNH